MSTAGKQEGLGCAKKVGQWAEAGRGNESVILCGGQGTWPVAASKCKQR